MNQPKTFKDIRNTIEFACVWSVINMASIILFAWKFNRLFDWHIAWTCVVLEVGAALCSWAIFWLYRKENSPFPDSDVEHYKVHGFASLMVVVLILIWWAVKLVYWFARIAFSAIMLPLSAKLSAIKVSRREARRHTNFLALRAPLESLERALAELPRQADYRTTGASEAFTALKDAYAKVIGE